MFTHSPNKPLIKRALNHVKSIIKTALFSQKGGSLLTLVTIRIVPYPTYPIRLPLRLNRHQLF